MKRLNLPPVTNSNVLPFFAGLILLSLGAYLAYPPAGLIAPGLVLLYVALAGEAKEQ
jgi:hypothetical protein